MSVVMTVELAQIKTLAVCSHLSTTGGNMLVTCKV